MALIVLNAILALWSTFVFLVFLGFGVLEWLMMNICAPTQFLAVIGLLSGRKIIMNISVPMLLFFGGDGLFMFGWEGYMIQAQVSHLIMVITALYILYISYKSGETREILIGAGIGILIVLIFMLVIFPWYYQNPDPRVVEMMKDMGFGRDSG